MSGAMTTLHKHPSTVCRPRVVRPPGRTTYLVQISGRADTRAAGEILATFGRAGAVIETVDQSAVHDHLSLNIVCCLPDGEGLLKELLLATYGQGLTIDFEPIERVPAIAAEAADLTLVGSFIGAAELAAVSEVVAAAGAEVDRMERLSREPVWSYQLRVVGGDRRRLRIGLASLRERFPALDVAMRSTGLPLRALRAIVLDVDRTLVKNEMIDEIADLAGVGNEVAMITDLAMRGEIEFEAALRKRVALFAGQPVEILDQAWERLELTTGATNVLATLRRLGFTVGIISGGFTAITDRLKNELGLDYAFANTLEVADGTLTGALTGPVVDRRRKADLLASIAQCERLTLDQMVAVGDGANDIDMLEAAGLGIAFNAKRGVGVAADASLNVPHLDALLAFLGVGHAERAPAGEQAMGSTR